MIRHTRVGIEFNIVPTCRYTCTWYAINATESGWMDGGWTEGRKEGRKEWLRVGTGAYSCRHSALLTYLLTLWAHLAKVTSHDSQVVSSQCSIVGACIVAQVVHWVVHQLGRHLRVSRRKRGNPTPMQMPMPMPMPRSTKFQQRVQQRVLWSNTQCPRTSTPWSRRTTQYQGTPAFASGCIPTCVSVVQIT